MHPPAHLRIHKPACSNACYRTIPVDCLFHIKGDTRERVMTINESMVPALEVYSIDNNKLHTVDVQSQMARSWTLTLVLTEISLAYRRTHSLQSA
ncbi:hypothetical protein FPT15_22505 [Pseudomonas sp. RGB]|nr:hypothetical protein FPT15_22505 [Pseudomonas sp. RGB]